MSVYTGKCRLSLLAVLVIGVLFTTAASTDGEVLRTHLVSKGDTLYSISRQYGLKLEELCALNRITENATLYVGQELVIERVGRSGSLQSGSGAPGGSYVAQKGDTFYSIARAHSVTVTELLAVNGLKASSVLKANQSLRIPGDAIVLTETGVTQKAPSAPSAPRAAAPQTSRRTLWPVTPTKITYVKGKLTGVELAAAPSSAVESVSTGTVIYSGEYRGFGNVVFVKAPRDYVYVYTNLGTVAVETGKKVDLATNLGRTGSGNFTFMVYRNGNPVDPATAPRA